MTNAQSARDWSAGRSRWRQGGDCQAFRGGLDQRGKGQGVRHRTPTICSSSATGWADATRWIRPSGFRQCSRSGPDRVSSEMLAGFHEMDEHFRTAPFEQKPTGADWACFPCGTAISSTRRRSPCCPSEQYLKRFPAYLQQLTMESNGKHVTLDGKRRSITRPDRFTGGEPGHQRAAFLLSTYPPGHAADPM